MRASTLLSWVAVWALGFVRASIRARTGGVAGVGVVENTLAEPEDYLLHIILSGAYICDDALNDALCDNLRDVHAWAPINVELFLVDSVCQPMVSHVHCF
jgi:hypothetical protein